MSRFSGASSQKEEIGVFRTLLIQDGVIQNFEKQIERLILDSRQLGFTYHEQKIFAPPETSRLKIIVTPYGTTHEILSYTPPKSKILTLYPEPIEGPRIKSLQYMNRHFIREYAQSNGCDDALVTTQDGYITEISNANFFYEYEGKRVTACPSLPYLKGLTIDLLPGMNYAKFRLKDIPKGAQGFVCNSLIGIVPVCLSQVK